MIPENPTEAEAKAVALNLLPHLEYLLLRAIELSGQKLMVAVASANNPVMQALADKMLCDMAEVQRQIAVAHASGSAPWLADFAAPFFSLCGTQTGRVTMTVAPNLSSLAASA